MQAKTASRNCKQKLQAEIASTNCKHKLQARFEFKTRQIMKLLNQKAKVTFFFDRNQPMTQPLAGKNTLWLVELKFFQKKLIIATKKKTPSERVWKTRSEKGVFFLCTILFKVTWAFWKTWWQTTEQISIYGHFCLIFSSTPPASI